MPNHVTNILRVSPEVAEGISRKFTEEEIAEHEREQVESDRRYKERTGKDWPYPREPLPERFVDFGMVVPEPESIFHGGCNGQHPHPKEDGSGFYEYCWNGWNHENWGTKWNAYDSTVEPVEGDLAQVKFDTAWSHPYPVILRLSLNFPDEQIEVAYADEDLGVNCGAYVMMGGVVIKESDLSSDDALDFAAQVKYGKSYKELQKEWGEEDE